MGRVLQTLPTAPVYNLAFFGPLLTSLHLFDRDAIVYEGVIGLHIRLTRADFDSKKEFLHWKPWSDGDYYNTYNTEKNRYSFYDNGIPLEPYVDNRCGPLH